MTNGKFTNGHFVVVATWVMLVVALVGAGFAIYGVYSPTSIYHTKQEDLAALETTVATLERTVGNQGGNLAALQGTVGAQGAAIVTLHGTVGKQEGAVARLEEKLSNHGAVAAKMQMQMESVEGEVATRVPLRIVKPSTDESIRVTFDNTLPWGKSTEERFCPTGHYVCGVMQRVDPAGGSGYDDTALNGIDLYCCPFTH